MLPDKCCLDKCDCDSWHHKGPRNISLKFGRNRVSNSGDMADIEFALVGGDGEMQSHFCVKPNLRQC